jgi:adenylyl-sulfate kinase
VLKQVLLSYAQQKRYGHFKMAKLVWITGLSGSGKTTIATKVYHQLKKQHTNTILLDGDHFRDVMGSAHGYTLADRFEVATKIHNMCKFLVNQEIHVVCATMSLFEEIHQRNREAFQEYYEIFIECDMSELIRRDQKGLYSKAIKGEISDVVGVDLPFDKPKQCNLIIENTQQNNLTEKVQNILNLLGETN